MASWDSAHRAAHGPRALDLSAPLLLLVVDGPDRGLRAALPVGMSRVGEAADCALVLSDPAVSRHHVELELGDRGIVARDLGSRNGCFHGGARFREVVVGVGAAITVGNTTFKVVSAQSLETSIPPSAARRFGGLVGGSLRMREVYAILERVALSNAPILIEAETGTGKELCARAIHDASPRAAGPFVVCDLAGVSRSLLESELFGHVRGAFTGAERDRRGLFEAADGGTLFLDEIGELELGEQPRLLRALEQKEVRPVGSAAARRIDVRVIAATNRDLGEEVAEGRFREDLLHRLRVVSVRLPPLRERKEDIPELVAALTTGAERIAVPDETLALLAEYDWPGNVRELRNVLERARSLALPESGERVLRPALLGLTTPTAPAAPADTSSYREAKERLLAAWERQYITQLLKRCEGNVSRAARVGGMDRAYLHKLIRRFQLDPGASR